MINSGQLFFNMKVSINDEVCGKYTDNKFYEKDKKRFVKVLKEHVNDAGSLDSLDVLDILNLLEQSKWNGTVVNNSTTIRPIPVVKDKHGKLIKDYDIEDWFYKLNEELDEIKWAVFFDSTTNHFNAEAEHNKKIAAEELQDLKHVCTTMQHWLGFNDKAIDELCNETNAKNQRRGYFKEE